MTSTIKHLCLMFALGCLLVGSPVTAVAAPGAGDPVDLIGVRVTDVTGHHHRIGISMGSVQPAVLVFLDTACPVATRYVPTLNALHAEAEARGVALYGVLSNPAITWQASADFVDDFGVTFPVILDSTGDLALRLGPRVTSESFVISTADRVVYRGRIDDRFAAVGKLRTRIASHDLQHCHRGRGGGRRPARALRRRRQIGCFHHDLGPVGRERHWAGRGHVQPPHRAAARSQLRRMPSSRAASRRSPSKATTTRNAGTAWSPS